MTEPSDENKPDNPPTDEPDPKAADEPTPSPAAEETPASGAATEAAPPEGAPTEIAEPEINDSSGYAPAAGWYPDPNAGGANVMRYWDGSAWTEKVKEGETEINTTRRTPMERKAILAQQLQGAAARGLRIESQSEFQAILVKGKPVNHTLHAILTIFTCLVWGIVWAVIAATGGEKREMIVVDEFGNVQYQRLGKG